MKKTFWILIIVLALGVPLSIAGLGIAAAIIVPHFMTPSSGSRVSSTMTDLKMIRSELQLYRAQHGDTFPDSFVDQMTMYTDRTGNTSISHTSRFRYGPYVIRIPPNQYTGVNTVTTVTDPAASYKPAGDMSQGWWYNSATGEFRCYVPDRVKAPDGSQINGM